MIHLVPTKASRQVLSVLVSALVISLGAVPMIASDLDDPQIADGEPRTAEVEPGSQDFAIEERPEGTLHFVRSAATTFVQYEDSNTWAYGGAGCIYRTGGTSFFELDVQIPDGVTLDFLRVYFDDTDAVNNASAILWAFDGAGGLTNLATAESSGTPGIGSAGSGFFSHVVDNTSEALALRITFGSATTSALRICGVRLRYTMP